MDDRVGAGEQCRVRVIWPPLALAVIAWCPADQPDHLVAAGRQQRGQGRPDQPARPGERDRQRLRAHLPGPRVRGQVRHELPVPVPEHRPQRPGRDRRGDNVHDHGATGARGREHVRVPPAERGPQRRQQDIGKPARRVVAARVMSGYPAQTAGQREHRLPVADRRCLPHHAYRLPRRHQARDGPRRECQANTSSGSARTTLEYVSPMIVPPPSVRDF